MATFSSYRSEQDPIKTLFRKIKRKTVDSEFSSSDVFVPNSCIEELATDQAIVDILKRSGCRLSRKKLSTFVFNPEKPAKKIFLISVMSGFRGTELKQLLKVFRQADFHDGCLPITEDNRKNYLFFEESHISWAGVLMATFEENQWRFLPPTIKQGVSLPQLERRIPLPFTSVQRDVAAGGYGSVHKATVHREHIEHEAFPAHMKVCDVALKQMRKDGGEGGAHQDYSANQDIQKLKHDHIVQFIAAIQRGEDEHYLMFVWANGKDLGQYWKTVRKPTLSADFVRAVIEQCHGLMDGLHVLHNMEGWHYRHTDIKPANILRSIDDPVRDEKEIGVLRISDLGLAKRHFVSTDMRDGTNAQAATTRYRPPEAAFRIAEGGLGRRYDIWSMGCVLLEFIIWMLHGTDTLDLFKKDGLGKEGDSATPYFQRPKARHIDVNPVVSETINTLLLKDPECQGDTAIGDLLRLVKDKMLVVGLGTTSKESSALLAVPQKAAYSTSGAVRATSKELLVELVRILSHEKGSSYWFTGQSREAAPALEFSHKEIERGEPSYVEHQELFMVTIDEEPTQNENGGLTANYTNGQTGFNEYRNIAELNDMWEYSTDNRLASEVLRNHQDQDQVYFQTDKTRLCKKCAGLALVTPLFSFTDTWPELEKSRIECDFCNLRWKVCRGLNQARAPKLRFEREGSLLKLNGSYPPAMAICRGFEEASDPDDNPIQMGFPRLPPAGSPTSFRLIRTWLRDCDENHPACRVLQKHAVPTRLVDVGTAQSPLIRLYETQNGDTMEYIALSHSWGQGPHFFTRTSNINEFKQNIDFGMLPGTFQHAVVATRELGVRYIWIDCLCIIQGSGGDFAQEAEKMEGVFSTAYCVLAVCSSKGQWDGFLKQREKERDFVTVKRHEQPPLYVCSFVDNFGHDVLDSNLSHRGWVLQEHALARRTIFFTEAQMYWECGDGVRCQSLTKMSNKLASFLGDPNFPSKISGDNSLRGEKILFYENMYRQYSRLQFTQITDRAVAIAGLQQRLLHDLRAHGGFGVFDDGRSLLQHSLLWQRGEEVASLTRIDFSGNGSSPDGGLPSWSWMSYNEGIDFLDLPLGKVRWLPEEIISPWADVQGGPVMTSSMWSRSEEPRAVPEISIRVRSFQIDADTLQTSDSVEYSIIYDVPDPTRTAGRGQVECVLMGKARDRDKPDKQLMHYVLFVTPRDSGEQAYERVGVGYLLGKFIDLDSPGVLARLR